MQCYFVIRFIYICTVQLQIIYFLFIAIDEFRLHNEKYFGMLSSGIRNKLRNMNDILRETKRLN